MGRKRLAAGKDLVVFVRPIERRVQPHTPENAVQFRIGGKVLRQCEEFLWRRWVDRFGGAPQRDHPLHLLSDIVANLIFLEVEASERGKTKECQGATVTNLIDPEVEGRERGESGQRLRPVVANFVPRKIKRCESGQTRQCPKAIVADGVA
jgi:hypothetical protein